MPTPFEHTWLRMCSSPLKSLIWMVPPVAHSLGTGRNLKSSPISTKATFTPAALAFLNATSATPPGAAPPVGRPSVITSIISTTARPEEVSILRTSLTARSMRVLTPMASAPVPLTFMLLLLASAVVLFPVSSKYLCATDANCTAPKCMPSSAIGKSLTSLPMNS